MIADCFSGNCPQKGSPGQEFLVAIDRESKYKFHLKKCQFFESFKYFESRREKTVKLLRVGSNVQGDTKIW